MLGVLRSEPTNNSVLMFEGSGSALLPKPKLAALGGKGFPAAQKRRENKPLPPSVKQESEIP
jgi:hypothetical protein